MLSIWNLIFVCEIARARIGSMLGASSYTLEPTIWLQGLVKKCFKTKKIKKLEKGFVTITSAIITPQLSPCASAQALFFSFLLFALLRRKSFWPPSKESIFQSSLHLLQITIFHLWAIIISHYLSRCDQIEPLLYFFWISTRAILQSNSMYIAGPKVPYKHASSGIRYTIRKGSNLLYEKGWTKPQRLNTRKHSQL